MKFNYLAILLVVISCCASSFSQERNFEIKVSMEDTSISKNTKAFPVKVKVTNKAGQDLHIENLGEVEFGFSKCLTLTNCDGSNMTYNSSVRFSKKTLRENESFEVEFDLMKLHWWDTYSSYIDTKFPSNFKKVISSEFNYFQAVIDLPYGYKIDKTSKRKIPVKKSFRSNTINVVINK